DCALARLHGLTVSHARPLYEDLTISVKSNFQVGLMTRLETTPTEFVESAGITFAYRRLGAPNGIPLGAVPALYGPHGLVGSGRCEWLSKRWARLRLRQRGSRTIQWCDTGQRRSDGGGRQSFHVGARAYQHGPARILAGRVCRPADGVQPSGQGARPGTSGHGPSRWRGALDGCRQ